MTQRKRTAARAVALAGLFICAEVIPGAVHAAAPTAIPIAGGESEWRELQHSSVSPDGKWLTYDIVGGSETDTGTLYIKSLESPQSYTVPRAYWPVFSNDGKWLAYSVGAVADSEARTELLNLASGHRESFSNVARQAFSPDGRWLVVWLNPGEDSAGGEVKLRDLRTDAEKSLSHVSDYLIDAQSRFLIYLVDAPQLQGNGVYCLTLKTGQRRVLLARGRKFSGLAWHEAGARLAVLQGAEEEGLKQRINTLMVWRGMGTANEETLEWTPVAKNGFPDGYVLSEHAPLRWSSDGERLIAGIKEQKPSQELKPGPATTPANVIVWHWKDVESQPVQAQNAPERERNGTLAGVIHLSSGRFVQIERAGSVPQALFRLPQNARFTRDARWALANDERPYLSPRLPNDSFLHDVYRIDASTGRRDLIASRVTNSQFFSEEHQWLVYLADDKVLRACHLPTGRTTTLDEPAGLRAARSEKLDFRVGGARWTADGKAVLFHAEHDIWLLPLDGGRAVNLTRGVGEARKITFRLPPSEEFSITGETLARMETDNTFSGLQTGGASIDVSRPLTLSAFGEYSKQSGYWRLDPGGAPRPLIWEYELFSQYSAAAHADRIVFTRQTFTQYPDLWIGSRNFKSLRRVTDLYPHLQQDHAWGRNMPVDFNLADGTRLQAILTLPADYEPGKRYPMVVSQYEMLSDYMYKFHLPYAPDTRMTVNPSLYASNGYLVLRPDIPHRDERPGSHALECIASAVSKAIEMGYADPARLGLIGFSFGGYHVNFAITHTSMFAAAVSGGGWTDLAGAELRNPGQIETAQFVMGNLWERPELYLSQSPVHHVSRMTTPLLLFKGDRDLPLGDQPLMFYNAARRLGKPVVMLQYPDSGHGTTARDDADFRTRIAQFFDHYLKGKPAPQWLSDGVPWLQQSGSSR